jgi:hypothetical protein
MRLADGSKRRTALDAAADCKARRRRLRVAGYRRAAFLR